MIIKSSISLFKIPSINEGMKEKLFKYFVEHEYTEERGFGFTSVDKEDDILSATLIKRSTTLFSSYDPVLRQIVKKELFLFSEIDFLLDTNFGVLEIYGATKDIPKIKAVIAPLFKDRFLFNPLETGPYNVIPILFRNDIFVEIQKMTVNNFKFNEGVSGKYEAYITNTKLGLKILNDYKNDVLNSQVILNSEEFDNITLIVGKEGRLAVECNEIELRKLLEYIKSLILT